MKTLTTFQSYSGGLSADLGEDRNVFVWNACPGEYSSNGSGTFNINVPDGLSGIFIGDRSLYDLVSEIAGTAQLEDVDRQLEEIIS